jgi:hypothetical protein
MRARCRVLVRGRPRCCVRTGGATPQHARRGAAQRNARVQQPQEPPGRWWMEHVLQACLCAYVALAWGVCSSGGCARRRRVPPLPPPTAPSHSQRHYAASCRGSRSIVAAGTSLRAWRHGWLASRSWGLFLSLLATALAVRADGAGLWLLSARHHRRCWCCYRCCFACVHGGHRRHGVALYRGLPHTYTPARARFRFAHTAAHRGALPALSLAVACQHTTARPRHRRAGGAATLCCQPRDGRQRRVSALNGIRLTRPCFASPPHLHSSPIRRATAATTFRQVRTEAGAAGRAIDMEACKYAAKSIIHSIASENSEQRTRDLCLCRSRLVCLPWPHVLCRARPHRCRTPHHSLHDTPHVETSATSPHLLTEQSRLALDAI